MAAIDLLCVELMVASMLVLFFVLDPKHVSFVSFISASGGKVEDVVPVCQPCVCVHAQ